MQRKSSVFQEIKNQFRFGSITNRLLLLNFFVFVGIHLYLAILKLSNTPDEGYLHLPEKIFSLNTDPTLILYRPWTLITSLFAHYEFFHFLQNMLFLFVTGRLLEQFFDKNKVFWIYLLGGITGSIFELLAHNTLPYYEGSTANVLGASGALMAMLSAIAFYKPHLKIPFFGLFEVRILFIAVFFILLDLLNLSKGVNDQIAHFSHIGGVFFGFIAIQNMHTSNNVLNFTERMWQRLKQFFSRKRNSTSKQSRQFKKDEDYAYEKTKKQERTDMILDKIAKSGYESLNKEEKDFLFNQSKNL